MNTYDTFGQLGLAWCQDISEAYDSLCTVQAGPVLPETPMPMPDLTNNVAIWRLLPLSMADEISCAYINVLIYLFVQHINHSGKTWKNPG